MADKSPGRPQISQEPQTAGRWLSQIPDGRHVRLHWLEIVPEQNLGVTTQTSP